MQSERQATTPLFRLFSGWTNKLSRYGSLAILSSLLLIVPVSTSFAVPSNISQIGTRPSPTAEPNALIRQISVRILGEQDSGSGVLLSQQGQRYTVLTNAHVVAGTDAGYTLLTADGQSHQGQWLRDMQFADQDLALVQFDSSRSYAVVQLRQNNRFRTGETVYAAGFPNWRLLSPTRLEETRAEGFQALEVTTGEVKLLLAKPLEQGYQLGYTNEVAAGMSGGPVLDRRGQLVGINGGLKYPPQGIAAFTFADGTLPSLPLFEQMEALSWAIPVSTIRRLLHLP